MTSRTVSQLLVDLGVSSRAIPVRTSPTTTPTRSLQFKTLKYSPRFPKRYTNIAGARAFCDGFFEYYNNEHRHSGIGLHTPADVHFGLAGGRPREAPGRPRRRLRLHARTVQEPPQAPRIPQAFWINRPEEVPLAVAAI